MSLTKIVTNPKNWTHIFIFEKAKKSNTKLIKIMKEKLLITFSVIKWFLNLFDILNINNI